MPSILRAALAALLLSAAPALAGDIGIHHPYAIASRPGAPTGTAYMLIHNHGDQDDRLLSASSPAAERVELHTTTEENGVLRMQPIEGGLPIPADGELDLSRGGPHIMFMGVKEPFEDGDVIELTLTFEKAGEMTFRVPVDLGRLTDDAPMADHGEHAMPEEGHDHGDHAEPEGHDHEGHGG
ncbi:copper chaperone PCu(A)C [Rubellimicrobium arenae]|uniref:copper chaperone PCu(A)C n=1 Tax=Rubellimicrobium arenae TaxID=2817372 RepID=UPI001B307E42|nr:copper chaperone PCu(A)C [Rubellimicrobium arenae]